MPIQFNHAIQNVVRTIDLSKQLNGNDSDWIVWWYAGIYRNYRQNSVPNITVVFRKIINDKLSDEVVLKTIPISYLGQVRIGSIWKGGRCNRQVAFDELNNSIVDFSEGGWTFNSFQDALSTHKAAPYPNNIYPLQYSRDKSQFLEFPLQNGGKLLIPCLEFFASCYGHSEELNRVLATYPWQQGQEALIDRLTATIDAPEDERWLVNLQPLISNADAVLVAHLKYDAYAQQKARQIYSQIEVAYRGGTPSGGAFIQVSPWFEGLAELNVEGISFNGNSFLALRVNGVSEPDGLPIERYRRYKNKEEVAGGNHGGAELDTLVLPRSSVKKPDIVQITSDDEPDRNAAGAVILNNDRVRLGVPRIVIPAKLSKTGNRHVVVTRDNSNPTEFATGEDHGQGKGVGKALIYSNQIMESHGALRDMWNAMLYLKRKYPSQIQSVDWFTFKDDFNSDVEPSVICLSPFEDNEARQIAASTVNWCYFDVQNAIPRGILATRMVVDSKSVFILEIQRRPRNKKKGEDPEIGEESYKGFVFTLTDDSDFESTLRKFMSGVRMVKGVVQNLSLEFDGKFGVFKHVPAAGEVVPCETAVVNALDKINVKLG